MKVIRWVSLVWSLLLWHGASADVWTYDGEFETNGVLYRLQHYYFRPDVPTEYKAVPLMFTGGDATILPQNSKLQEVYLVDTADIKNLGGLAESVRISFADQALIGGIHCLWSVSNCSSVILEDISLNLTPSTTTYYDRYEHYSLEAKLFAGCPDFKMIVYGGDIPTVSYGAKSVSIETIQDILWHTEEFYYPAQYSNSWESAIKKLSFNGKYGAYFGKEFSRENIIPDSGNLKSVEPPIVTNYVYSTITNYVFSTVTNEVFHYSTVTNEIFHYTTVTNVVKYVPEPGASPDAGYGVNVGAGGETVIAGAAGWDTFGVPDGMEWDKETGTLSGLAKLSGTYDLILVSGSGADTKIMRTTLMVAPYDTIIGYVGVAFSQSGAPLDNLKSYKTLPAGLKWKNGTLSGVPTKAQALDLETADGEPVKIEIKALPDSVVGTFDGCVYFPPSDPTNGIANICDIGGTITLTATAAGKISASVKTAKKTYSFSMASWAKFAEGDAFTLEASAGLKTGEALQVNATVCDGATMVHAKLSGGEFGGRGTTTLPEEADDDGCVMMLAKDVYSKSGAKWINPEAHGLMAKCAGTYQFGFDAVEDGGHGVTALPAWTLRPVTKVEPAFLKIVVKDTGVATITGSLPDKTHINCTAKATATEEGKNGVVLRIVTAAFPGKYTAVPLSIVITSDGAPLNDEENCGMVYSVKR